VNLAGKNEYQMPNPRLQLTAKAPSANLGTRSWLFGKNRSWTQVGGSLTAIVGLFPSLLIRES